LTERFGSRSSNARLNPALAKLFGSVPKGDVQNIFAQVKKKKEKREVAEKAAVDRTVTKGLEFYRHGTGKSAKKYPKLPAHGTDLVTPPDQVVKIQGARMQIEINNAIIYYRVMDFYRRGRGAPWGSIDAGHAAMINQLEVLLTRGPRSRDLGKNVPGAMLEQVFVSALSTVKIKLAKGATATHKQRTQDVTGFF
jgi:hypothetical protein